MQMDETTTYVLSKCKLSVVQIGNELLTLAKEFEIALQDTSPQTKHTDLLPRQMHLGHEDDRNRSKIS